MRGKKLGSLAVISAAWAAAPTCVFGQVSDLNISPVQPVVRAPVAGNGGELGMQFPRYYTGSGNVGAFAGTSGVWQGPPDDVNVIGTSTFALYSGSWSEAAKWNGSIPNGGGTAEMGEPFAAGTIERRGGTTAILDQNVTLSQLTYSNNLGSEVTTLDGAQNNVDTGKTITTSSTGLSIVAGPNAYVTPSHTGSFIWLDGNRVRPSIIGTGSVTVSGGQPVLLAGVNSFSGGLNITNGGIVGLEAYGASAGDPGVPSRVAPAVGAGAIPPTG